jgi:hypothetical protein
MLLLLHLLLLLMLTMGAPASTSGCNWHRRCHCCGDSVSVAADAALCLGISLSTGELRVARMSEHQWAVSKVLGDVRESVCGRSEVGEERSGIWWSLWK